MPIVAGALPRQIQRAYPERAASSGGKRREWCETIRRGKSGWCAPPTLFNRKDAGGADVWHPKPRIVALYVGGERSIRWEVAAEFLREALRWRCSSRFLVSLRQVCCARQTKTDPARANPGKL